jgi:Mrp family chromosome partitioning ATPase/capsular polysaccharide biosynthesis protein
LAGALSVSATVNPEADIVDVKAGADDPKRAALVANTVARTFLAQRTQQETNRIASARQQLQNELNRLQVQSGTETQTAALRERISQLSVLELSAGTDMQIVEPAEAPSSASSPRPFRNGVLAAFGALFLGVLLALGRDQLSPRVANPRELGRLLDVRVLAGVPYVRGARRKARRLMSGAEVEAYQTLRAALEIAVPPSQGAAILVTGAVHGEGKTTVTWQLGNGLARAGHRTLMISADLRVPRLQVLAHADSRIGLGDLLLGMELEGGALEPALIDEAITEVLPAGSGVRGYGCLHVIASGTDYKDPGSLLAGPSIATFMNQVKGMGYDYVLVDAPPMLGIADSQVLARHVDNILLVSRLDRLTLDNVAALREALDGLDRPVLGVVVIGARGEASPYYLTRRGPLVSEAEAST